MRRAEPGALPDECPCALVEPGAHGILVTAVNTHARRDGVHPGQSLADARAALPGLSTRKAERARDRAALLGLARWIGRYGPARNIAGEDGVWIDVTGVAHLFGGEPRLMADLVTRLGAFGLTARAGLADTAAAAFALARYAPAGGSRFAIAPPARTREALAGLSVEALDLPQDAVLLLRRLGLRRIGQLYELPRAALARRFRSTDGRGGRVGADGLAGTVLARLDVALGSAPEARHALAEAPRPRVRRIFAEPLISAEGIDGAIAELADSLCRRLDDAATGARRLRLRLYRADGTVTEVGAGTSRPCREPRHLQRLLAPKVAAVDAGFGIDALTLEATVAEPHEPAQAALAAGLEPDTRAEAALLIDRLASRLGPERVVCLALAASHIPERAEARVPALGARREGNAAGPAARALPARPPLLLAPPEPITVLAEVPEGPPARFTWRRVSHVVARAEGPERIAPEWWRLPEPATHSDPAQRPRDYYRIEDDRGGRYWVFRAGLYGRDTGDAPPLWYMHGLFA